jgi:hypothetical protein
VPDAWLVYEPFAGKVTVKVTEPDAPLPTLPTAHVTLPPANAPGGEADTKVDPVGIASLSTTFSAGPGPLLPYAIVYVTLEVLTEVGALLVSASSGCPSEVTHPAS